MNDPIPRIVVATDEAAALKVYRDILQPLRFEVICYGQVETVVEIVRRLREQQQPAALAFLDMRTPLDYESLWTAQRLRVFDPDLYLIIVAAEADIDLRRISHPASPPDRLLYVPKPFHRMEILQLAHVLSAKWQAEQALGNLNGLRAARDAAEAANRAKSLFLATMSHEIRTPLNGLSAAVELLADTPLTVDQQRLTHIIRSSAEVLLTTINDVLDFSRIEAGRLTLDLGSLSLSQLVEDAANVLVLRVQEKNLMLFTFVDPAAPDHLRGDAPRLRQVLINLLGNAIKFTPTGHIVVRVILEHRAGEKAMLLFEVEDTGIGIPLDKQQVVFEPFMQADSGTARNYGGAGLGLAISQAIIANMGGRIEIESEEGRGARFWFRIALEALPDRRAPDADLNGVQVLLCLNNAIEADILGCYLTARGAESQRIAAGDAVRFINQGKWRVMVAEYARFHNTPFARLAEKRGLTLVLLTSHFVQEASATGVQELLRPVQRRTLINAVATAVGRSIPKNHPSQGRRACDLNRRSRGLRLLLAEDHPTNQTVLRLLLEQLGHEVDIADNGEAAWEMLQKKTYDLLITDAHMPGLGGHDLARRIRADEAGGRRHLPIIALTADARSESAWESRAAGIDDWLSKPTSRKALRKAIAEVFTHQYLSDTSMALRAEPGSHVDVLVNHASPADEPVLDSSILLDGVLMGQSERLVSVLHDFITENRAHLAKLQDFWTAGAFEEARSSAHAIKGAAQMTGALRLAACCQRLEDAIKSRQLQEAGLLSAAVHEAVEAVEAAIAALAAD